VFSEIGDRIRVTMLDQPIPVNKRKKKDVGKEGKSDVDYAQCRNAALGTFSFILRSGLLGDFASPRPALS